jgi:large subunit ribosomal protein L22
MAAVTETRPGARAIAKWVRTSPRKARLVTDHIRGRTVPEARTILAFTPRAAAREVEKVLRSAVANAEANHGLIGDELFVATAVVDEGVTLKRWRPQARGRAHRIRKRTCHITISLQTLVAVPATEDQEHGRGRRRQEPETVEAVEETPAVVEESLAPEGEAEPVVEAEEPDETRRTPAEAQPEPESERGES